MLEVFGRLCSMRRKRPDDIQPQDPPEDALEAAVTSSLPLPARVDDDEFRRLVEVARHGHWAAEEVARLAAHLAASGERAVWCDSWKTADVASTGGPGSLSTLLAPLWLRTNGCHVVKLAVPGRPAGAIDSLGTLPGYRVQLSTDEVRSVIALCGFAHFLADDRFAPLDAALFQYRRRNGAVAIPTLAAASLLAKKVAVGVRRVGLDVRVGPHGNFGVSRAEARENATVFCAAGRLLGIDAVAFIGGENAPAQPWIGRGESLVALAHALGIRRVDDPDSWLDSHSITCQRMATEIARATDANSQDLPSSKSLDVVREAFEAHLEAQGATMGDFLERVEDVYSTPRITLHAEGTGALRLDLARLRDVLVAAQADADHCAFPDPAGLRLLIRPGNPVIVGEPIAAVRCSPSLDADDLIARVKSAFRMLHATQGDASSTSEGVQGMEVVHA
jgi:thymidine phosphorylase